MSKTSVMSVVRNTDYWTPLEQSFVNTYIKHKYMIAELIVTDT